MVTCRELIDETSRLVVTLASWGVSVMLIVYLILRLALGDRFWAVAAVNNFAFYCFLPLLCLIPLGLITRAKWGLVTTLPLALIALIWFVPYFTVKSSPSAAAQPVKVVTFNVFWQNGRLDDALQWIENMDADVLLLQEIAAAEFFPMTLRLQSLYPYGNSQFAIGSRWGNLFMSRYPIVESERLTEADNFSPNTQQRYVVDINGQQVAIYNIDAAPAAGIPRFELPFVSGLFAEYFLGYDNAGRDYQIDRVMERVLTETLPYIVAGDFNMSEQSILYGELAANMRDSFREVGQGLGATWPVAEADWRLPGFMPTLLRVDYIWHSDTFRAVEAWKGPELGSDHLPVYAELELIAE